MKVLFTIAWRDLKQLLVSPMFYIVGGLCASIWSYSFLRDMQAFAAQMGMMQLQGMSSGMNIHFTLFVQHIQIVNLIMIVAVPALTMRLIAEEKKTRTFDLLLTAPITSTQIVVGKFLAGYAAALLLVLLAFMYPLAASLVADFHWGPVVTSYVGLALVVGLYVSVGLFSSSVSSSAVLAVVLGLVLNLIFWFFGQAPDAADSKWLMAFMEHASIGQQFFAFLKGTFRLSSFVFFISVIGLFVFLSQRVVESARWR